MAPNGAAAGTFGYLIYFTNKSSAPCSLYGYPGVSLTGGSSATQIGAAARRQSTAPSTEVTLAPEGKAYASLLIGDALNYPMAACSPANASDLRVYPPDETQSVLVPLKVTGCQSTSAQLLTIYVIR